jgi:CheY-like chemotaxis protein
MRDKAIRRVAQSAAGEQSGRSRTQAGQAAAGGPPSTGAGKDRGARARGSSPERIPAAAASADTSDPAPTSATIDSLDRANASEANASEANASEANASEANASEAPLTARSCEGWVDPRSAQGLPLTEAQAPPHLQGKLDGSTQPAWPASEVRRALIVDDDPEVCRALARVLRPELDVYVATSVGEAEAWLARVEQVDLAFVDLELPDGTGEQVLERLTRWPDAIAVLISGRISGNENPLKNRALATLVLGKPVPFHVVEALKRGTLGLPNG